MPIPAILLARPPDPPLELIQYRFDRAIQGHGSIERMVGLRSRPSIQQLDSAWRLDGGIRANANSQPNVEVGRSWGDEDERYHPDNVEKDSGFLILVHGPLLYFHAK